MAERRLPDSPPPVEEDRPQFSGNQTPNPPIDSTTHNYTGSRSLFWCDVCEVGFPWRSKFDRHVASAKHQKKIDLLTVVQPSCSMPSESPPSDFSPDRSLVSTVVSH